MFRVIVLNSSYIILTVFCHLVRQPSCQAAFPDGYCSDPFQHFDVKMPRILSSENVLTLLLFFDTFHNEFFLFRNEACKTDFSPFFLVWHGSNLRVMSGCILSVINKLLKVFCSDLVQKFPTGQYGFWTAFLELVLRIKL